jgi:hypothetical protein
VRVRVPVLRPFPAGILTMAVRPAPASVTVEGPVAFGRGLTLAALVVGAALLLGRAASRRRAEYSSESPLFGLRLPRLPRLPRGW